MKLGSQPVVAGVLSCLLAACGGGEGSGGGSPSTATNAAPTLSADTTAATVRENNSGAVITLQASDPDGDATTLSLSGEDAAFFTLNADGTIAFREAPNYDLFADADHDNSYALTAKVSDGRGGSKSLSLTVTVQNDKEGVSTSRVASFGEAGLLVAPVAEEDRLLVVKSDGSLIQFDLASSGQTKIGNIFNAGETGRVLAATQDRAWIFVMIAIDGKGTFVRFYHATNEFASRPTPMLASSVDPDATGSLFKVGGYLKAFLGDPDGDDAQLAGSGFGKLFDLNFDPYCGASLNSICLTADIVGNGIHQPEGGGSYNGLAFLFDRGTDKQDEVTYYNPDARPLDFGWPAREGTYERTANPPTAVNGPFLTFERGNGFGRAGGLVGGAVYTGSIASLQDKLIFADSSGKILSAPAKFMTDGYLHSGFEVEDRSDDFAPATGSIAEPKSVFLSQGGNLFILDANGDLFRVG